MAAETTLKFKIAGDSREYAAPPIDDLDIDDWVLMYEYAGLVLDDFAPIEDEEAEEARQRRLGHPGFTKALLHIAYKRANPDKKPAEIKAAVGTVKFLPLMAELGDAVRAAEEADGLPPDETTEPDASSPESSVDSNASTSNPSPTGSGQPDGQPAPTGTGG